MSKYNEDLDYLIKDDDISVDEINEIIAMADKIIFAPNSNKSKLIKAYLKKVQCLQKLDKCEESKEYIEILLKLKPDMPEAHVRLGIVYDEKEDYDEAYSCIKQSIDIKPNYAYAHYWLGSVYSSKGKHFETIKSDDEAIKLYPNYVSAYIARGWAHIMIGNSDNALKDFNKVTSLNPKSHKGYDGQGFIYLYLQKNYKKAIKSFTKAINIKNDKWRYYSCRSEAYENIQENKKALADLEKALELDPQNKDLISKKLALLTKINDDFGEITANRFIAFFDIMGFKDFIIKNKLEKVYEILNQLTQRIRKLADDNVIDKKYKYFVKVTTYSDSIILFSRDNSQDSLEAITVWSKYLMAIAMNQVKEIALQQGNCPEVPIKGAIAYGELSVDDTNKVFCGQPLIDAFLLEEELHYYGVIFHNSFNDFISKNNKLFLDVCNSDYCKETFVEISTPLKSKNGGKYKVKHLNLNWFNLIHHKEDFRKVIYNFRATTSGKTREYIDNTVSIYEELTKIKMPTFNEQLKFAQQLNEINSILNDANYKTFSELDIWNDNLPFLSISFADDIPEDDNNIMLIGDIVVSDECNKEDVIFLINKLNNIYKNIKDLTDETLGDEGLRLDIRKIIISRRIIDDVDIKNKFDESNIICASLDKQESNYLTGIIPKSRVNTTEDEKEEIESYTEYIETLIDYFKKTNES